MTEELVRVNVEYMNPGGVCRELDDALRNEAERLGGQVFGSGYFLAEHTRDIGLGVPVSSVPEFKKFAEKAKEEFLS